MGCPRRARSKARWNATPVHGLQEIECRHRPRRLPAPKDGRLATIHGKNWVNISTIDLQAGYWQVAVRKQDQDKTAFISPFGLFRFARMPFVLRKAPAPSMERFRAGLPDLTLSPISMTLYSFQLLNKSILYSWNAFSNTSEISSCA
jgi:hypothetical protein